MNESTSTSYIQGQIYERCYSSWFSDKLVCLVGFVGPGTVGTTEEYGQEEMRF